MEKKTMLHFNYIIYLDKIGVFSNESPKVLDIGTQNLLGIDEDLALEFICKHGADKNSESVIKEVKRIVYYSTPRPGERTTYLSELFDLTNISYTSFDVCPGLSTEIFDLNTQKIGRLQKGTFDLVMNCGTAEHVLNQLNIFKLVHQALKVGGIWFDQPPSVGFVNHGYFLYHPKFYYDMATANQYHIDNIWYSPAGHTDVLDRKVKKTDVNGLINDTFEELTEKEISGNYYNLNVLCLKTTDNALDFSCSY